MFFKHGSHSLDLVAEHKLFVVFSKSSSLCVTIRQFPCWHLEQRVVNLQDWIKGRGSLLNNCREISYLCQLSCKCVILFSPINYRSSHFMFEFKVKIQDRKCNISENSYQGIPIFVFILHSQVTTLKECKLVNFDVPLFLRGFYIFWNHICRHVCSYFTGIAIFPLKL